MSIRIKGKAKDRPTEGIPEETPNALTAETLRRSDQGKDLHEAGAIDGLLGNSASSAALLADLDPGATNAHLGGARHRSA